MPSSHRKKGASNTQSIQAKFPASRPLSSSPSSSTSTTLTSTTNAAGRTTLGSPPPPASSSSQVAVNVAPQEESATVSRNEPRASSSLPLSDLESITLAKLSRKNEQLAQLAKDTLPPMRSTDTDTHVTHPLLMPRDEYLARQNRVFEELTGFNSWAEYKRNWVEEEEKDEPLARITEMVIAGLDESVYNEFQEQRYIMDEIDYAAVQAVKSIRSYNDNPTRHSALEANYGVLKGQVSRLEVEFSKTRSQKLELESLRQQAQSEYQQEAMRRQKIEVICKALVTKVENLEQENRYLKKSAKDLEKKNAMLQELLERSAKKSESSPSPSTTVAAASAASALPVRRESSTIPTIPEQEPWKVTAAANAEAILAAQNIVTGVAQHLKSSGYAQYIDESIQGNVDNSRNLSPILKALDGLLETYSDVIEKFKASSLEEEDWKSMLTAILKQYKARADLFEHVLSEKDLLYSIYAAKCKSLHEELEVTRNRALVLTDSYMEIFSSKDPLEAMTKLRDKHESAGAAADAITAAVASKANSSDGSSSSGPLSSGMANSLGKSDVLFAPTDPGSEATLADENLWILRLYGVEQLMAQKESLLEVLKHLEGGNFSKEDLGKVWSTTTLFRMFDPIDTIRERLPWRYITYDTEGKLDSKALYERFNELTHALAKALFVAVPAAHKGLSKLVLSAEGESSSQEDNSTIAAQSAPNDKQEEPDEQPSQALQRPDEVPSASKSGTEPNDGTAAAVAPVIAHEKEEEEQKKEIVTEGGESNGSAVASDSRIDPSSETTEKNGDDGHENHKVPLGDHQSSTADDHTTEAESPPQAVADDREHIPEISPKRLRNVVQEYFSHAPATADFFKKQFGFDLTGKTFSEVLLEFASKGEHDCHDTDCPIHHSTAQHRPVWNEVVESMFSGVNGGIHHVAPNGNGNGTYRQRGGDNDNAADDNDESGGVGALTFGERNANKPMFGPERPPALQV